MNKSDSIRSLQGDDALGQGPSPFGRASAPLIVAFLLAIVVLALAATPATAAPKPIAGFIGESPGTEGGRFSSPRDIAIYTGTDSNPANDKLFIVESNRVKRLDRHGNFELIWGKDVIASNAVGDTGVGFEVCSQAVTGAAGCKAGAPGSAEGEMRQPQGIAVSQSTGHVYVMDRDNFRVQEFDLDGQFVRAWGGLGSAEGEFGETQAEGVGIAVDPLNGDVFVADPANSRVQQFSSTGVFIAAFGSAGGGLGEFGADEPTRLVVDSNHVVYISDSNDSNRVQRYDAAADAFLALIACCDPAPDAPLLEGVTIGLEVDPDTDGAGPDQEHLLVARDRTSLDADTVVQELDIPTPASDPVTTVVDTHVYEADPTTANSNTHDRKVNGIGVSANGDLYLLAPHIYTPLFAGPTYATFTGCESQSYCSGLLVLSSESGPLASVILDADPAATSAALTGSANAGGGVATYRFELSTDDGESWQDTGVRGYVSGLDDLPVAGELTGLQPNTPYSVRVVVRRQTGYSTHLTENSNEFSFLTDIAPPDVETLGTSQRTDTSARLRGRIDPNGIETDYRFEYGLAGEALDGQIPISDASAGAGNASLLVTADLVGLAPETDYEYRIVASNDAGTAEGDVVAFRTDPVPAPVGPLARAFELVSPADKVSGVGVADWYGGPATAVDAGVAAYEGERFAVQSTLGSVMMDGPYSYANDWAMAERTPAGWVSKPGISRRAYGPQPKAFVEMNMAAEDLSTMAWGSNGHTIRLFPEMEAWNDQVIQQVLYLRDWDSDSWELFGPTDPAQAVGGQNITKGAGAVAADGSAVVASAEGGPRGMAGPGDPTNPVFPDLQSGHAIYLDQTSGGFSDVFPGDDGVRELVNVCTAGTVLPAVADVGGQLKQAAEACPAPGPGRDARLTSSKGASLALTLDGDSEGVISGDGSRVFFMSPDPQGGANSCSGTGVDTECPAQLFVWQRGVDGGVSTRWISRTEVSAANGAAADQDAGLMAPALFEGASGDGDKAFFRTVAPLTADDRNGAGAVPAGGVTAGAPHPESGDLYMYDLPDGPDGDPATPDGDPGGGDLVRISAGPDDSGDCNAPTGSLRFVSGDGARVYFTCAAPLPGVPVPGSGTSTSPGGTRTSTDQMNLYLYDAERPLAQRWRFIARVPDSCVTTSPDSCVRGTPDGSFATFFATAALTDDDPDATSRDFYGYDAIGDELVRLSAPQGGPCQPHSCHAEAPFVRSRNSQVLPRLGVAARPVGADPEGEKLAFFQSRARLVPEDLNDAYDVYQWRARDGRLSLLSTGAEGAHDTMFVGNDRSGLNVYIATRGRLTWQDKDAVLDVYTARIGGGFPEPIVPPACDVLADACQGAPAPAPSAPGLASAAFQGPGNVVERRKRVRRCAKGKIRRRGRCVRRCAGGKVRRRGRCVRKRSGKRSHQKQRRAQHSHQRANPDRRTSR